MELTIDELKTIYSALHVVQSLTLARGRAEECQILHEKIGEQIEIVEQKRNKILAVEILKELFNK